MKQLFSIILAIILSTTSYGQSNDCGTAIPFVDNDCALFFPSPTSITRCFSFNSPGTFIDFTFIPFVPQGTCGDAVSWYSLYDSDCNLDTVNLDGLYTNLQPNSDYVVCYTVQCPTTGVINFLCNQELIILPVELIDFTAKPSNEIILQWSVASEYECLGYFLERSTNLERWINIGFVEGQGNTSQYTTYSFVDTEPVRGINYYSLKQVDVNGNFKYLKTIAVFWDPEIILSPFRQYNILGQKIY